MDHHHQQQQQQGSNSNDRLVVEVYPLTNYYFASSKDKDADHPSTSCSYSQRIQRLQLSYAEHGMRICVHGVLLVELLQQPHVLLLQVRNSFFKLPGGRLRVGESDAEGLTRKLSKRLSGNGGNGDWLIGECLGMWWRSEFETLPFPYLPPKPRRAKECTKLFLIRLPESRQFVVPRNMKLLAVPLCQLHDNSETYGPVISAIPYLLSKFSFSTIED